jgi:hypothetical protein
LVRKIYQNIQEIVENWLKKIKIYKMKAILGKKTQFEEGNSKLDI